MIRSNVSFILTMVDESFLGMVPCYPNNCFLRANVDDV